MLYIDAHCDSIAPFSQPPQLDVERMRVSESGVQFMAAFSPDFEAVKDMLDKMDGFEAALAAADPGWRILRAVEGGECLNGDLRRLDWLYRRGVRSLGLTWNGANALSGGADTPGLGLTSFGAQVIERMEELGMLVDLAHISPEGFFGALEVCKKPPIVSHTAAHALNPHRRNLTDGQIRAIALRGGVIGVCLYPVFLGGDTPETVTRHIEHIKNTGGRGCVGLGTDFDGIDQLPRGITGVQDMPKLFELLDEHTIGLNFWRLVRELP
ncbi:MAG: membrane dipeptidase [Oscillospiraceae bacterium]|nr:membrane dipeptidase [Oscillospiraceae bacterium]